MLCCETWDVVFLLSFWDSPMGWIQLPGHDLYVSQLIVSKRKTKQNKKKPEMRSKQVLLELRDWAHGGIHLEEAAVCCTEGSQVQIHLNYWQSSFWLSQRSSVKTWASSRQSTITAAHSVWTEASCQWKPRLGEHLQTKHTAQTKLECLGWTSRVLTWTELNISAETWKLLQSNLTEPERICRKKKTPEHPSKRFEILSQFYFWIFQKNCHFSVCTPRLWNFQPAQ